MNFFKGVLWAWAIIAAIVIGLGIIVGILNLGFYLTGSENAVVAGFFILIFSLLGGVLYSEGEENSE